MTHKKVNNADAGTADLFGGNDGDKWSDYASGVDVDDYDINSDTQYRYDKFQVRNSANTFGHKHRSLATAARTFTYPDTDITLPERLPPATWTVYKAGSTYKAMNIDPAIAVLSGSNFKTNIWDNIINTPAAKNHIHFLDGVYDIASGSTLSPGVNNSDFHMSGESMFATILRPLGNNIVLDAINGRRQTFENFMIYVDQGTSYTADAFRLTASSNGVEHVTCRNIKIRQDAGTSTITNTTGRAFVLVATGTSNPNFNTNDFYYMNMQGFVTAITLTNTAITGFVWANEQHFSHIHAQHCQAFFRGNMPASGDHMWGISFDNCTFQTTTVTGTTQHCFDFEPTTNPSIVRANIDNCVMWDPPSNTHKFLKATTNCRILVKGGGAYPSSSPASDALGDQWMGGTGFNAASGTWNTGAYVERLSSHGMTKGATSIADGGAITHRLTATPRYVEVTPSIAGTIAAVTNISSSTFTVSLKAASLTTAAATQTVYWTAREYF